MSIHTKRAALVCLFFYREHRRQARRLSGRL
jgi:hypothetical protein